MIYMVKFQHIIVVGVSITDYSAFSNYNRFDRFFATLQQFQIIICYVFSSVFLHNNDKCIDQIANAKRKMKLHLEGNSCRHKLSI